MVQVLTRILRALMRILFRVKVIGLENYHAAGDRVLIVANHVSLLDGILLYLFLPEPPTFAINTDIHKRWYFKPFYRFADLFVLDPLNPLSLKSLIKFLKQDKKAVIFPEGRITVTGTLMKIYEGTGLVAEKSEAMVLPVGIEGAQFSKLSYMQGKLKRHWLPKITLTIHPPVDLHDQADRVGASQRLVDIMHELVYRNINTDRTLFAAVIQAMNLHGASREIVCDSQRNTLTYRQLLTRSFILGKYISSQTQAGEKVGVLLPNASANVVMLLGLHAYGRVPAMLNFTAGPQGLVTACETAQINTVYTSRAFVEKGELGDVINALESVVNVVFLEDLRAHIGTRQKLAGLVKARFPQLAFSIRAHRLSPSDTAVVLFTSGSEGIPKGVVLSHKNILSNYAQIHTYIGLNKTDIIFNALPMFHSFGFTAGTFLPLLDGSKVFLYPTPLHYKVIPELIYQLGATVLFGTNTFLSGYVRHAHPADMQSLRYVVAGAEKLQEETRNAWFEKFGQRILEGYGATETSPVLSVNTPMFYKAGSVGRLLPGIEYHLEPVDGMHDGARLHVKGPNIMKGYLFHGSDGDIIPPQTDLGLGWYDTGDIVTLDDQKYVTIAGRAKRFAKIGGEMVSLTRVEDLANKTWPGCLHAAAVVPDKRKGEQIVLFTEQAGAERKALVTQAKKLGYAELNVPREVVVVKTIPILGTGKTNFGAINELAKDYKQAKKPRGN